MPPSEVHLLSLSVHLFVSYKVCEHDILGKNDSFCVAKLRDNHYFENVPEDTFLAFLMPFMESK